MKDANFFPEMGKSTFYGGPLMFEPDRPRARTHVSLDKATPGARYCISPCDARVAARRAPGCRNGVARCRPTDACRSTFPVVRRALFSARHGYWRNDVPPIHPAMTFKYFRTRCGIPSLLPARDIREKLVNVRWMRNRTLSLSQCFPNWLPIPRWKELSTSIVSAPEWRQKYVT